MAKTIAMIRVVFTEINENKEFCLTFDMYRPLLKYLSVCTE